MAEIDQKIENLEFGTETGKILNLMIHSLYTNKDIFLRELVSNASDACDKLRYLSITTQDLLEDNPNLKIIIKIDEAERTISISDNGIGMNREDLINNIGTIASSGTQKFLENMTGDNKQDLQLIGQFGVGFYSSFMVADRVTVRSRKASEKTSWKWESDGNGSYQISPLNEEVSRGTEIILHLKKDMDEYLDKFRISHIVKTYSDHISVPIELIDNDNKSEIINNGAALWKKSKTEITEDQYKDFYKAVSHQPDSPWMTLHNKNEGKVEFTNLLFIPTMKPFDLFHPDRKSRVKLYVKRVYIAEEGIDLIPANLRFLRGVVDSEDLPLNINRESLQYNSVITKIKQSITKRVYSELKKRLAEDREGYEKFWLNFGSCIKEGLCEALDDKNQILDICLFKSAQQNKYITLSEYLESMQPKQQKIYYLSGNEGDNLKASPQVEGFLKNNIDVLLFTDTVDDFWVNVCNEYQEKQILSVTRAGLDLDEIVDNQQDKNEEIDNKDLEQEHQDILNFFKNILGTKISDAKISKKLVDSPVCLSVREGAMDIRMERYLKEQKQIAHSSAKVIEVNFKHPLIQKIVSFMKDSKLNDAEELVNILFDQACILEGEQVHDVVEFAKRMNNYLKLAVNY